RGFREAEMGLGSGSGERPRCLHRVVERRDGPGRRGAGGGAMSEAVSLVLNVLSQVTVLALIALGLAIIFGMMDIVNLAHGEFVTLGAFTLTALQHVGGVDAYWAALLLAPLVGAMAGLALEASVIRFLYHRTLDTLLATYAVSLIV